MAVFLVTTESNDWILLSITDTVNKCGLILTEIYNIRKKKSEILHVNQHHWCFFGCSRWNFTSECGHNKVVEVCCYTVPHGECLLLSLTSSDLIFSCGILLLIFLPRIDESSIKKGKMLDWWVGNPGEGKPVYSVRIMVNWLKFENLLSDWAFGISSSLSYNSIGFTIFWDCLCFLR